MTRSPQPAGAAIRLGLRENLGQFSLLVVVKAFAEFVAGGLLLGIGTAMVYPTLLAAIGDVAHPTADVFGLDVAMWVIAALTFASGLVSALRMSETLQITRE